MKVYILIIFQLLQMVLISFGECPLHAVLPQPTYFRLGKTRFYVHATNTNLPLKLDHLSKSKGTCLQLLKNHTGNVTVRIASFLDKISTNAIIARHLEKLVEKKNITTFTFWLFAKAGSKKEGDYRWYETFNDTNPQSVAQYGNFFYRAPRKIGVTNTKDDLNEILVSKPNTFLDESNEPNLENVHTVLNTAVNSQRCLAFSLPFKNNPNLGWQTSWIERYCNDQLSPLCEIYPERQCDEYNTLNPKVLSEDKEYYYTEGNWIFANRRYVMNWKPVREYVKGIRDVQECITLEVNANSTSNIC